MKPQDLETKKETSFKFEELEKEIEGVFEKISLSNSKKKELIMEIIKKKMGYQPKPVPRKLKLYPTDSETNHTRYKTNDGRYSLVIAHSIHDYKWYFYAANDKNVNKSYNSLWENKSYKTEEECVRMAENWLSKAINDGTIK